ncbi:MAG: hypothetical protein IPI60_00970 [Saprospiraceae bacterium]|nr:hypothetical protein [Saprospiraceae bacterium]
MSKFLKGLKSLFIIEEASTAAEEETTAETSANVAPAQSDAPDARKQQDGGKVNQRFSEILLKALEDNNQSGLDYLEFKQSLQSLEKMPMEEQVKFHSAFAMAQSMGATAPKLIESAQYYVSVLQKEENKFGTALNTQYNDQIQGRQEAIEKELASIKSKSEQITKLTEEIKVHQQQHETLKTQLEESQGKIETTKNDFIASYNNLVAQIQDDIEKIKQFLK